MLPAARSSRVPTAVAAAGLLLSLAALMQPRAEWGGHSPAVRVALPVPEIMGLASAAIAALAGVIILVASRRRRATQRTLGVARPAPLRWWSRVLAELGPVLPLLMIVFVLWLDDGRVAGVLLALGRTLFAAGDAAPPPAPESPVVTLPWLGWAVGVVEVVVALMALALAVVLLFAEQIAAWLARTSDDDAAELAEAVEEGLDDLADEPDPRRGILACYRRFEGAAARARVRRAPWQTAEEFMRDAQRRLPLPALSVERLTRLFEVARFSHHPVRTAERDLARTCLADIRAALVRTEDGHAGA